MAALLETLKYLRDKVIQRIVNFFLCLRRSISWAIFMWGNYDWDYGFVYDMLEKKLRALRASILAGRHSDKWVTAAQITLALSHLKLYRDEGFSSQLLKQFEEKYGTLTMKSGASDPGARTAPCIFGFRTKNDTYVWDNEHPEFQKYHLMYHRVRNRLERRSQWHKKRFFSILEYEMEGWWD